MILLETTNLTKTYGTKTVVNDISLKIQAGQLVAFLGPNGAGKSTTIGMLTGLIQPSSGKITMGTATPNQAAYRQQIGVVFQDSRLDRQLTVKRTWKSVRKCIPKLIRPGLITWSTNLI